MSLAHSALHHQEKTQHVWVLSSVQSQVWAFSGSRTLKVAWTSRENCSGKSRQSPCSIECSVRCTMGISVLLFVTVGLL